MVAAAAVVPVISPGTASAAGPCDVTSLHSQGFSHEENFWPYRDGVVTWMTDSARLEFWKNGASGARLIRGANLIANGKSGLIVKGGTTGGGYQLGQSGGIGSAPYGGWCSNVTYGPVWGYLGFWAGGKWWRTGDISFY
jgi:hypothetical protein